jgi:hypothetical protein
VYHNPGQLLPVEDPPLAVELAQVRIRIVELAYEAIVECRVEVRHATRGQPYLSLTPDETLALAELLRRRALKALGSDRPRRVGSGRRRP